MCSCRLFIVFLTTGLITAFIVGYLFQEEEAVNIPKTGYWGKARIQSLSDAPKDDLTIKKYTIQVEDAVLDDLRKRLEKTRFVEPLEDVKFHYGFNSNTLRKVVDYWLNKYDWRKEERALNAFNHYKTQIEGIDIHFMHVKPNVDTSKVRVLPLLMTHGWPGSIVEFTKVIPLLTQPKNGIAFEMVCPSIPGYGFSEAPHKQGFNGLAAARIFVKLMERLGHPRFYAQGGDWGHMVTSFIGSFFPERVYGVHLNGVFLDLKGIGALKTTALMVYPYPFLDTPELPRNFPYPFSQFFSYFMREMGYLHLQATKPDTVGSALVDSPAGLAAYILEKFSTWTNRDNTDAEDGNLTEKYSLDQLLTNVMVYWVTNTITSSMRFYKENLGNAEVFKAMKATLSVPTGLALFPEEIVGNPRTVAKHKYHNIVTFTYIPRGGHFSAMEEPELQEADIRRFVEAVEAKATRKTGEPIRAQYPAGKQSTENVPNVVKSEYDSIPAEPTRQPPVRHEKPKTPPPEAAKQKQAEKQVPKKTVDTKPSSASKPEATKKPTPSKEQKPQQDKKPAVKPQTSQKSPPPPKEQAPTQKPSTPPKQAKSSETQSTTGKDSQPSKSQPSAQKKTETDKTGKSSSQTPPQPTKKTQSPPPAQKPSEQPQPSAQKVKTPSPTQKPPEPQKQQKETPPPSQKPSSSVPKQ